MPMVQSDTMEPVQSMLDGKYYDSRAKLRATYRPSGNREGKRYIELGNDQSVLTPTPYKRPKPDRKAIKEAVHRAWSQTA